MFSVLFVCTGNTCRSPMAAAMLENLLPERVAGKVRIESAGISAATGQPASEGAMKVTGKRGMDLSGHSSRRLTEELVENADLILVMQEMHLREVRRLCPKRVEHTLLLTELGKIPGGDRSGIADPFGGPDDVYEECFAQIEKNLQRGMEFLLELINTEEGQR